MDGSRDSLLDRRIEIDRREAYDLNYLSQGRVERRRVKERRSQAERREGWLRVSEWYSVCLQAITGNKGPSKS
jgi:hypothetical protein